MDLTRNAAGIRGRRQAVVSAGLAALLAAGSTGALAAGPPVEETKRLLHEHVLRENGRLRSSMSLGDLLRLSHLHTLRENDRR